ncbi:hypothetical protein DSUL_40119 [Desulfovibrionales bacterium]
MLPALILVFLVVGKTGIFFISQIKKYIWVSSGYGPYYMNIYVQIWNIVMLMVQADAGNLPIWLD